VAAIQDLLPRLAEDQGAIPEDLSYKSPAGAWSKLDAMPLDAYINAIGASGWLKDFLNVAYDTEYGLATRDQSALNLAWLVGAELVDDRFEVFGASDERFKIKGGNQSLVDALAARYQASLQLGHRLEAISATANGYRLSFAQANGPSVEVDAEHVIMTVPFSILRDVSIKIELPAVKKRVIAELGYGTNAKLLLGVRKRTWIEAGYLGNFFTDDGLESGWDNSLMQAGEAAGLTVFTGAAGGLKLAEGTAVSQAEARLDRLDALFPGTKAAYTGKAERFNWPTHPWTKASYSAYKPGQYAAFRGSEGEAVGNLRFAGEHTSLDFQGYMEGGAESGVRAAGEVLTALGKVPAPTAPSKRRIMVGSA
jgi:monoamine oxidase